MVALVVRRLALLLFVLVGISLLTFTISRVIPSDPARLIAGRSADASTLATVRHEYGLDKSLPAQYLSYVSGVARGDFGTSTVTRRPVGDDIATFFPATIELIIFALILTVVLGIPLGVLSAVKAGGAIDRISRIASIAGSALPLFWLGLLLQLLFYGRLGWLPSSGRLDTFTEPPPQVTGLFTVDSILAGSPALFLEALAHLILPAFTLACASLAMMIRVTRSTMLEALTQDYVRTARAKGLSRSAVVVRHALRNALITPVTLIGLQAGFLLSGAFLVEIVFNWPGIGFYSISAIRGSDYQAIMSITLLVAVVYSLVNLVCDLVYMKLDPRISYS